MHTLSTSNTHTMAVKRMLSKHIIKSDQFLDMPASTQALYFHLCMEADDDGIVSNPRLVMRQCSCTADDIHLLLAKKFVLQFKSGVLVIKHWLIHNTIQSDRYTPSTYTEERNSLLIKENRAYSFSEGTPFLLCIQTGNKVETQLSKGKVSKGKTISVSEKEEQFNRLWQFFPKKVGKQAAKRWWLRREYTEAEVTTMIEALKQQARSKQWTQGYIPNPLTWLNRGGWEDQLEEAKPHQQFKSYTK